MFSKGEIPFVRFLIPLISGIVAGMNWPFETIANLWVIPAIGTIVFSALIIFYRHTNLDKYSWLPGIAAQALILISGCVLTLQAAGKYDSAYFTKFPANALIVSVSTEPQISKAALKFEAKVTHRVYLNKSLPVSGKLLVSMRIIPGNTNEIRYGSTLLIPSTYKVVDPPFNPGEFNFKGYLEGKQIYYQSFVHINSVKILSQQDGNQLIGFAITLRQRLVRKFYSYMDGDAAALASTLILGYRSSLGDDIIKAYSNTGTMHVLSVSGMHVGIVFIVLTFILKPLSKITHLKVFTALFIITSIWLYSLLTGFSPSVCRAATMMTFIVSGKTLNRNFNNYNLLAVSAFFLLIYNPFYLVDVGFQLSYLAVLGLIFLQPKIYGLISPSNKLLDEAWNYSALSLAAQLATFPVSLYYFHQFPVYFLLSNLIVVLPVALIMYIGIFFLFIPWSSLLSIIGIVLNELIKATNQTLFRIEDLPFSSINGIWLDSYQYLLIYTIIGCVIWMYLTRQKSAFYVALMCSILFTIGITIDRINDSRSDEIIFYTLRQKSAVACIFRDEAYLITNVKSSDIAYTYSIKPALDRRGVKTVIFLNPDSSMSNRGVRISRNYWQFGNYKVLRWDNRMKYFSFMDRLNTNALLISGNPSITVGQLYRVVDFSVLIVDGSNAPNRIKQWQAQADVLNIPIKILKGSPAYVVRISSQN